MARKPEHLVRKVMLALLLQLLTDGNPATHEITDRLRPIGSSNRTLSENRRITLN